MGAYLVRRFLLMVLTLFGMSVLIFVMLRLVPGNIADILVDAAGIVDPDGEGQDRARARPRPADRRAVRPVDRRPGARRSRLRLRLGAAGDRGDRAAHPDQRQAGRHGAVLRRHDRRAARRHQRGAAEHAARLLPARAQSQRPVAAVVLARPAGADGVRQLVRLDPDLQQRAARPSGRSSGCSAIPAAVVGLPQLGADHAADALVDARGAAPGLHPHRALQGRLADRRSTTTTRCATRCCRWSPSSASRRRSWSAA